MMAGRSALARGAPIRASIRAAMRTEVARRQDSRGRHEGAALVESAFDSTPSMQASCRIRMSCSSNADQSRPQDQLVEHGLSVPRLRACARRGRNVRTAGARRLGIRWLEDRRAASQCARLAASIPRIIIIAGRIRLQACRDFSNRSGRRRGARDPMRWSKSVLAVPAYSFFTLPFST